MKYTNLLKGKQLERRTFYFMGTSNIIVVAHAVILFADKAWRMVYGLPHIRESERSQRTK